MWYVIPEALTASPGPSLGQLGSSEECPSPVYSTRKKGRSVPLRNDGAYMRTLNTEKTFFHCDIIRQSSLWEISFIEL